MIELQKLIKKEILVLKKSIKGYTWDLCLGCGCGPSAVSIYRPEDDSRKSTTACRRPMGQSRVSLFFEALRRIPGKSIIGTSFENI
jgi:hypothetical protein